jgi:hypothetical protein
MFTLGWRQMASHLFGDNAASYSCWPVFDVPYNLSHFLCIKYEFMFRCIVPGLDHPGPKINVMLKPLIDELKELWNRVEAYNSHKKQKFTLQAAYLLSIHDFMSYDIFSDGAFMADCLVRYVTLTLIVFILLLVGRSATLIIIDVGYHRNTPSECRRIALGKTLSSRKDHQNV